MTWERLKWIFLWKWRGFCSEGVIYRADMPRRAALGQIDGRIGVCYICGDSFDWKAHHYIGFTHAFPYCEECHRTKGAVLKIRTMYRLVREWHEMLPAELWIYRGPGGYVRVFLLSVIGILLGE